MKRAAFLIKFLFILSISFNIAFLIHMFTRSSHALPEPDKPVVEVNLSDEQKQAIEPRRVQLHKDNEAIKNEIAQCQAKLLAVLRDEKVDREKAARFIDEINNLQKKLQHNTLEEIMLMRGVMNPHQCNCLMDGLDAAMKGESRTCSGECCNPAK